MLRRTSGREEWRVFWARTGFLHSQVRGAAAPQRSDTRCQRIRDSQHSKCCQLRRYEKEANVRQIPMQDLRIDYSGESGIE